jgi:hypothetical protein
VFRYGPRRENAAAFAGRGRPITGRANTWAADSKFLAKMLGLRLFFYALTPSDRVIEFLSWQRGDRLISCGQSFPDGAVRDGKVFFPIGMGMCISSSAAEPFDDHE